MDINIAFSLKHSDIFSGSSGLLSIPTFNNKTEADNSLSKLMTNTINTSLVSSIDFNQQTVKANLLGDGVREFGVGLSDRDIQIHSIKIFPTLVETTDSPPH